MSAHRPAEDGKGSQRDNWDPADMPVILDFEKQWQEDRDFEAKPGYTARSCLKKLTNPGWGDGSVGKVLALDAEDLSSISRTHVP